MEGLEKNKKEINWENPSTDNMSDFLATLESYEDKNGSLAGIPDLYENGQFNKKLFAGILMYKAPQYALVGVDSAKEILEFMKKLNGKLKNPKLKETIVYLESQIPYLEVAKEISEKSHEDLKNMKKGLSKINWFTELEPEIEALTKASEANVLRAKVGLFYANLVNKTYDGLWDEYLISGKALGLEN